MKVLVVGSGGREHALAWKLAQSPAVEAMWAAPGNPGMAAVATCVPLKVTDLDGLATFAAEHRVDLTVVGPEVPLAEGIADVFAARGLRVFGPSKAGALVEASKVFTQELAQRAGVPVALGSSFDNPADAAAFAESLGWHTAVKADGLAAGKGVLVCRTEQEVKSALTEIMVDRAFGESGSRVVVQELLAGRETSVLCLTDGDTVVPLEPSQDYKRALDADEGLNTGGMGAYSPVPWLPAVERERTVKEIVEPLVAALAAEGRRFAGCFYAGVMVTADGPRLYEVNCRFGDPEAQVLMPRLRSDLADAMVACVDGTLAGHKLLWHDDACVTVALASGGYPGGYRTGVPITGVEGAGALDGVTVFHAGTAIDGGRLVTSGGRVLNVTATGPSIDDARIRAYEAVERIEFESMHYRTDIAHSY